MEGSEGEECAGGGGGRGAGKSPREKGAGEHDWLQRGSDVGVKRGERRSVGGVRGLLGFPFSFMPRDGCTITIKTYPVQAGTLEKQNRDVRPSIFIEAALF